MELLSKLKCDRLNKQSPKYNYYPLTLRELKQMQKEHMIKLLLTYAIWVLVLVIVVVSSEKASLIVLYSGVIISLFITRYSDLHKRIRKVMRTVNEKEN